MDEQDPMPSPHSPGTVGLPAVSGPESKQFTLVRGQYVDLNQDNNNLKELQVTQQDTETGDPLMQIQFLNDSKAFEDSR